MWQGVLRKRDRHHRYCLPCTTQQHCRLREEHARNAIKWDTIEATPGTFSYSKSDVIRDLAQKNGQKLRCHTLVWYTQLLNWVSNGGFDDATLIDILECHLTNEVTHYKGDCLHCDVVNEVLNEDGTHRDNVFYKMVGESYIPIASATTAAADPDAKLHHNEYNIENIGAKSTAAQNIVRLIQSYGAKIDGVGMQAHFIVGSSPSQVA
ncbi:glycoside hydrolase family 10 protein [Lophiostoma macrostomum CBS 122681]|uniref:Beta-xylanase n=1 Tax=Lophiostoma macrostomum CBS 122681 TaxID=1314788 RepID=A0A6A6T036_9PLEO|nr:glycoside hydrolase family 10 protein [Lophiostoma macrostomum CBS 122681]